MMDTSKLKQVQVHSMDVGSLSGVVIDGEHAMEIEPGYADCGVTWENIKCSCGFESHEFSGYGCWQHGHDGPPEGHVLDWQHSGMYEAAWEWLWKQPRLC